MPDNLTPDQLAELRRLLDAATGGTWFWQPGDPPPYAVWSDLTVIARAGRADDAHLIAALRNAAPALLGEIDELRHANDELRRRVELNDEAQRVFDEPMECGHPRRNLRINAVEGSSRCLRCELARAAEEAERLRAEVEAWQWCAEEGFAVFAPHAPFTDDWRLSSAQRIGGRGATLLEAVAAAKKQMEER